ncbi:hypothetical protein pb186bvf_015916 [Paramecium bursaria]
MYQIWNNQCSNSFLANLKSDLLNQQKLEIERLIDELRQQQSKMATSSYQVPLVTCKEQATDNETQKLKPQIAKSQLVDKNIEKKNCSKRRRKNKQRCYLEGVFLPNFIIGRWTQREHKLYLSFLDQNIDFMTSSGNSNRQEKVFKQMSEMIRSRTAAQCRSHHKKFDFSSYLSQKK